MYKTGLVGDNLTAHKPSAFYQVFGAEKAKSYLDWLAFVYPPKHVSWLAMAEPGGRSHRIIYFTRRLSKPACSRKEGVVMEIRAWPINRNAQQAKASWQVTTKAPLSSCMLKMYPTK